MNTQWRLFLRKTRIWYSAIGKEKT